MQQVQHGQKIFLQKYHFLIHNQIEGKSKKTYVSKKQQFYNYSKINTKFCLNNEIYLQDCSNKEGTGLV